jgi:hypothetical protein
MGKSMDERTVIRQEQQSVGKIIEPADIIEVVGIKTAFCKRLIERRPAFGSVFVTMTPRGLK